MIKALLKKQFAEIFKSYFVNQKTGKARSKGATIGLFVLFAFLMLFLGFVFFGMGMMLSEFLKMPGFEWLYFALMGIVAIFFGLFGSVFNTYASLYIAKDNDLLLSMPIPVKYLLISRLTSVVGLSLLYTSSVLIPATVVYLIIGSFSVLALIFQIILVFAVSLFVSVLSCLLGFVVAVISSKLKNKSFITVIISVVFIGVYYFFCFRMSDIIKSIFLNSDSVVKGIKVWGNLFYLIGMASMGKVVPMIVFTAITIIAFILCFIVLSRTFIGISTFNKGEKKTVYKATTEKQSTLESALIKKEFKRFTSSATYMLNCGLGVIIMPVIAVIAIIKRSTILEILGQIKTETPGFYKIIPIVIIVAVSLMTSMSSISVPSISLEGKNLWIYKSLPIEPSKILNAKIKLHIYITAVPVILTSIIFGFSAGLDFSTIILMSVFLYIYVYFGGTLGLILGLVKPNLNWVTETTPIKQSMPIFLNMIIGFAVPAVIMLVGYFTIELIGLEVFISAIIVVFALATRLLGNWVKTKGVEIFENL